MYTTKVAIVWVMGVATVAILAIPIEFVTGRGGADFHLPGPTLTTGRGRYFGRNPHPATVLSESPHIPWMGPRFAPPVLTGTGLVKG